VFVTTAHVPIVTVISSLLFVNPSTSVMQDNIIFMVCKYCHKRNEIFVRTFKQHINHDRLTGMASITLLISTGASAHFMKMRSNGPNMEPWSYYTILDEGNSVVLIVA
jgi:hypothetical protein